MDKEVVAEELQNTNTEQLPEEKEGAAPEKMLPESRVIELIKKAKYKGEKKMQDKLEAVTQELEQLRGQSEPQQAAPQQSIGGMQQVDPEQIRQQVMEKIKEEMLEQQRQQHQEMLQKQAQEVADSFYNKMGQGKEMFDDFDAVTSDFEPNAFPELVFLANEADNTAAIIYELKKNPQKLAALQVLVSQSPNMARSEITKLSQSIKANEEAARQEREVTEPLNRMKPSQAGAGSGSFSIKDLRNMSSLRG